MSVSIRLRREGTKNRPYYKVVVADSRSPRDGKFIEIIGTYDPKVEGENSQIKIDRAEHWMSRGAQPSDTVRSLLKRNRARAAASPDEAGEPAPKKPWKLPRRRRKPLSPQRPLLLPSSLLRERTTRQSRRNSARAIALTGQGAPRP
jgi:small subunit ribosomal protein S16